MILALFGVWTAGGLAAESAAVPTSVMPPRVAEGNRFSIMVEIEPVDAALVEVVEPEYPAALGRVGGVQVTTRDARSAELRSTQVRLDFQGNQAGRWIIDPLTIVTPQREYVTRPTLVEIALRNQPDLVPFDIEWRVHSDTVVEGQSVAVTLDMIRVTEVTFPDQISVQPPSGALFEEAPGVGEIESTRYGDIELFRVPVASYLLTPSASGALTLPPAEIAAFGLSRRAAALNLSVEPLPEGTGDTGAVGSFRFSSHIDHAEIGQDETVEVRMLLQGVGNLGFLQFPSVSAEGLVVSDSESSERFLSGPRGYVGARTQTIRLRPTAAGDFRISVAPFVWYDPESRTIHREAARTFPVRVVDRSEAVPVEPPQLPQLLSAEQIRRVSTLDLFRLPGTYLTTMPGLIMVTVVIYVRRRRRESIALFSVVLLLGAGMLIPAPDTEQLARVAEHYQQGEWAEAYEVSQQLLQQAADHPGLLYNAAVTAFAADHHARSVFLLRRALVMRPLFQQARETLAVVEDELGLNRQYALRRSVHPDAPLIASLILFYVLAVLVVIPAERRKAGYAISVIVALLCLGGSLATFGYALYARQEPLAIVGPDAAELRRIPEQEAETWLTLPPGTAVHPLASRENHTLIRTGYGLDGWMLAEHLLQQE